MAQKMDRKFFGKIIKAKDLSAVPDDQWMVFLNKDNAFPATLQFYRGECERLGADACQLQAVDEAIERLNRWRATHSNLCKTPDATLQEITALPIEAVNPTES